MRVFLTELDPEVILCCYKPCEECIVNADRALLMMGLEGTAINRSTSRIWKLCMTVKTNIFTIN